MTIRRCGTGAEARPRWAALVGCALRALRRPGESYSDVILRLVETRGAEQVFEPNPGHEMGARSGLDPLLPFEVGPVNGRKARESGLRLKASVAPKAVFKLAICALLLLLKSI